MNSIWGAFLSTLIFMLPPLLLPPSSPPPPEEKQKGDKREGQNQKSYFVQVPPFVRAVPILIKAFAPPPQAGDTVKFPLLTK